ncbi:hypothetical protein GQ457_03G041090 [Hibiscus cannabinus]
MTGIRLISTGIVQAANPKSQAPHINLTPWDLQFLLADYIQRGLLFHIPGFNHEYETFVVHGVKSSLSKALDHFFPLTGRLAAIKHDDGTTSFSVVCNSAGALFVHAAVDEVTTRDIIEPVYVPSIVDSFFPLHGVRNYEGTVKPLLAVQVTKLVDGVFISVSVNHSVIDGESFFHFFSSWLHMASGSPGLTNPPIFQRCFLNAIDDSHPIRIPDSYIKQTESEPTNAQPAVKVRVFHFTKEVISKLKEKANAEAGIKNRISSLQALLSHFWRSVVRNKKIDPNEETSYCLLIGARQRLPELSEAYFGNALQIGTITMKAKELLDNGLGHAAWQMNKVVTSYNEEKLRNFLECWKECPEQKRMSNMATNIAIVTSDSPRFDIYRGDTELGRPMAIRSGPANKFDGRITVHCGVEEGSIDIEVCLSLETFQAMENDKEFMDTVSIKS